MKMEQGWRQTASWWETADDVSQEFSHPQRESRCEILQRELFGPFLRPEHMAV